MPTLVYFVHGMGCGTASGTVNPASSWKDSIKETTTWMTKTFGLNKTVWVDGIPATPPSADDDAIWFVPITYHNVFDDFRRNAIGQEAQAVQSQIVKTLSGAQVTRLTTIPFLWQNCLDVLLWAMDDVVTQRQVMTQVMNSITAIDALARGLKKGTVRRILISHSLGTAVATNALHQLASSPDWLAMGGMDLWVTLANVSPFLFPNSDDVYGAPLVPLATSAAVQVMLNVRNDADPIPWLLPWRAWSPPTSGDAAANWIQAKSLGRFQQRTTTGVAALTGWSPDIAQVHGFANYLLAPGVAEFLAGAMRGTLFTPAELTTLQWPVTWTTLNRLSCVRDPAALQKLSSEVGLFRSMPVPGTGVTTSGGWFQRLLDAADMLLKWSAAC